MNVSRKWTAKEIDACKTAKGGFSRKSLRAMGISWPPQKGWRRALLSGKPLGTESSRQRDVVESTDTIDKYDRMGRALKRGVRPSYKVIGKETTERRTSLADVLDDLPDDIRAVFLEKLRAVNPGLPNKELWRDFVKHPDKYDSRKTHLGGMIREQKETVGLSEGGRPRKTGAPEEPVSRPTLADAGIDKKLSSRAQKLAPIQDHAANYQNRFEREWSEGAARRRLARQLDGAK